VARARLLLRPLVTSADEQDTERRASLLKAKLQDISSAPMLRRVNGAGFCLLGMLTDDLPKGYYIKMYWFTMLWVPMIPICVYLVDEPKGSYYRFFKRMSLSDFHSIYKGRLGRFYLTVLGEAVMGVVVVVSVVVTFLSILVGGR
jgi:hypothetical protein